MKKHDEIYELLTAFALGELTKEQTQRVRQHLKECDLCSNEVRKLKAVLDCTQQMKNKSVDETVFISAKEKLIERIESSKGETSATTKTQRRSIMQSKFAKFAIAAVVIAAVFVGLSILGVSPDGSSVAWASLAERVEQITTVTYRMHMKMKGMPGMPKDKVMDMETEIRLSSDYGMRMDASVEDKHVSQTYMLYAENALITIIPEQKKFMRMELTEQLRDKMREEANDPKKMVSDFMELDYVELGREEINGVLAEGVEVTDPKIAGGMLGDVIAQLWVDIETGFPVLIKMDFGSDDGSTEFNMVMEDFQWDIQLDAAEFAHVIPADYTSMGEVKMPEMNAEAAVEGFKLLMEINGGNFPKSMNLMEVLKEFGEIRGKQFRHPLLKQTDLFHGFVKTDQCFITQFHFSRPPFFGLELQLFHTGPFPGIAEQTLCVSV